MAMKHLEPDKGSPTIGRIDRIGPTHAQGLEHLVGVNSNIRQGEPLDDMRLDFDVTCGIAPLQINDRNFEVGLKTCFVSLERENCTIHPHSLYEYWLDAGAFKASAHQKTTAGRAHGVDAAVNADIDPTKGIAGFKAKFGFGITRKRNENSETSTEQNERVELVVTSGQDRWRIGDRHRGDARRPDSLLSGEYFSEIRDHNDPRPLCRLQWSNYAVPMLVTITISGSFGSMLIFSPEKTRLENSAVKTGAWKTLRRRSSQAAKRHETALRAHIAGFAVAKRINETQQKAGEQVLPNEFIILRLTLFPSPDTDHPLRQPV